MAQSFAMVLFKLAARALASLVSVSWASPTIVSTRIPPGFSYDLEALRGVGRLSEMAAMREHIERELGIRILDMPARRSEAVLSDTQAFYFDLVSENHDEDSFSLEGAFIPAFGPMSRRGKLVSWHERPLGDVNVILMKLASNRPVLLHELMHYLIATERIRNSGLSPKEFYDRLLEERRSIFFPETCSLFARQPLALRLTLMNLREELAVNMTLVERARELRISKTESENLVLENHLNVSRFLQPFEALVPRLMSEFPEKALEVTLPLVREKEAEKNLLLKWISEFEADRARPWWARALESCQQLVGGGFK